MSSMLGRDGAHESGAVFQIRSARNQAKSECSGGVGMAPLHGTKRRSQPLQESRSRPRCGFPHQARQRATGKGRRALSGRCLEAAYRC